MIETVGAGTLVAAHDGLTIGESPLSSAPPRSDAAAVIQLEYARYMGCDTLVIDPAANRWLERLAGLRSHLSRWYVATSSPPKASVYDLRQTSRWAAVAKLLATSTSDDGPPSILVWGTSVEVGGIFDECRVFHPPTDDAPLPYLDKTINVVVIATNDAVNVGEARRVALDGVVELSDGLPRVATNAHGGDGRGAPSVIAITGPGAPSDRWMALLEQQIDGDRPQIQVMGGADTFPSMSALDRLFEAWDANHVVVISADVAPVPGSIEALGRVVSERPDAAIVSAFIAAARFDSGATGHPEWAGVPDDPADAVRRVVAEAPLTFAAIARDHFLAARGSTAASIAGGADHRWLQTDEAIGIQLGGA